MKDTTKRNAYEPYAERQKDELELKTLNEGHHNCKQLKWWLTGKCAELT
jgi:hypothetical protein